ncbi:MAG: methyltransferase domain-containing protein [Pseudomonadota bacterium]
MFQQPSRSGTVQVFENADFRWMEFGDHIVQSAIALAAPERLVLAYTQWQLFALLFFALPPRHVLLLGLGGGALARWCAAAGFQVTAVDNDPVVIEACRRWFGVDDVWIANADAREYLHTCNTQYDLVLCDLFAHGGAPAWLAHPAFLDACRLSLRPGGWASFNLHAGPLPGPERSKVSVEETDTLVSVNDAEAVVQTMEACAAEPVVELGVPDQDNAIVVQPASQPQPMLRSTLDARAAEWERWSGLPFAQMARAVYARYGSRGRVRFVRHGQ